jgi:tetratricopeptide (TPR) repeat protein
MKYILAALFLFSTVFAQQNPVVLNDADQAILSYIHNAQLTDAEQLIDQQIQESPQNPKYYLLKTSLYFHARYLSPQGTDRDSIKALLAQWAQKTIDVTEKLDETIENKFYLGSAYSYKSRADILNQSYWDAYFSARKGKNYLEDVIKENPEFYDAYLHLGVQDYFVSTRVTGWRKSLAWILGMAGDRGKSLEYIEITADQGRLNKDEAKFISVEIFRFFENDNDKAFRYASEYFQKYPNNPFVEQQYLALALQGFVDEKGIAFFEEKIDSIRTAFKIDSDGTLNNLGYYYVGLENYDIAIAVFRKNIELFPDVANCYDSLGEAYMISGNREEAIKYYQIAYGKVFDDETLDEEGRELLIENIKSKLRELGAEISA